MPSFSCTVEVNIEAAELWDFLLEKLFNPERFNPNMELRSILKKADNLIIRQTYFNGNDYIEKVEMDAYMRTMNFTLEDNSEYQGNSRFVITPAGNKCQLTSTATWEVKPGIKDPKKLTEFEENAFQSILQIKDIVESRKVDLF